MYNIVNIILANGAVDYASVTLQSQPHKGVLLTVEPSESYSEGTYVNECCWCEVHILRKKTVRRQRTIFNHISLSSR